MINLITKLIRQALIKVNKLSKVQMHFFNRSTHRVIRQQQWMEFKERSRGVCQSLTAKVQTKSTKKKALSKLKESKRIQLLHLLDKVVEIPKLLVSQEL